MVAAVTRLLVLGGTAMVGRAVAQLGAARGFEVTTFNRGLTPDGLPDAVRRLHGDRTDAATLAPLAAQEWDVVVDTWSTAPVTVRDSARLLSARAARYVYVSSASVYDDPGLGVDESWPTVQASPDAGATDYAADKRGAELAVLEAFGERCLLARAGLILGPHENVGRLPWWLDRMTRGDEVLAPGPPQRPLQWVDARDLAAFVLDTSLRGPCNVVGRPGAGTTRDLLEECASLAGVPGTTLRWLAPENVAEAGLEPWTEIPIWVPPTGETEWLMAIDVERAFAAGLSTRPLADTIADTWAWLRTLPGARLPDPPSGRPLPGISPEREAAALALAAARGADRGGQPPAG
jgi:nucleoside-diphosphate-sugar epimerase